MYKLWDVLTIFTTISVCLSLCYSNFVNNAVTQKLMHGIQRNFIFIKLHFDIHFLLDFVEYNPANMPCFLMNYMINLSYGIRHQFGEILQKLHKKVEEV